MNYTAIIIEPRKHKALEFVLNNACDCLPDNWTIVFFHGMDNTEYATKIVEKLNLLFNNRIQLVQLDIINLNSLEYSTLFTTKSIIYEYITTETFLIFQTDSMIFKKNIYLLDQYLDYDYVGAPWLITEYLPTKNSGFIGNGGFSLRKKSKMLEIVDKIPYNNIHYEDLYFSTNYDGIGIHVNKPDYSLACNFCVDEVYCELTLACHKPWFPPHYTNFKEVYPECEILRELQDVEL